MLQIKSFRMNFTTAALIIVFLLPNFFLYASTSRTFTYSLSEVSFDTLQGFDMVNMPGADKIDSLGKPNLPYYHFNFIIPNNMDVSSVQITASSFEIIEGSYYIYPAQPDPKTCTPPEQLPFEEPDSATYNSSNPYPGILAECIGMGFFDGANKIASIAVYPLQYKPLNQKIILYTSISINLQFSASSDMPVYPQIRTGWGIRIYQNGLESLVINTEDISSYGYTPEENNEPYQVDQIYWYPYTVITTEAMASHYSNFIEWECMKGIPAGVVAVEDILIEYPDGDLISGINDEAGSIRQYLADGWEYYGVVFALLGGDENAVPVRYGCDEWAYDQTPADLYYTDFNGDWNVDGDDLYGEFYDDDVDYNPEIFVGRLTANSPTKVTWWFINGVI